MQSRICKCPTQCYKNLLFSLCGNIFHGPAKGDQVLKKSVNAIKTKSSTDILFGYVWLRLGLGIGGKGAIVGI